MYLACTKHFDPPEHIEDTGKIVRVPEHISHCTKDMKKYEGKNVKINSICLLVCR